MSSANVKFSVIMPCYNSESYVRSAVDSILAQTYPNWELVAVNDGSTDSTEDILKAYAQNDNRIKVYKKENGGYVSAVNFGLDKITGDYFLLMGSDDRLSENLFNELVRNMSDALPDCIAFLTEKIKNGVSVGLDSYTNFDSVVYENNISLREMREKYPSHTDILCIRDTSKCFITEKLGSLRYYGKYGLDADGIFSMLFCHKAASFLSVPVVGYYWTLRDESVSGRKTTEAPMIDRINNWIIFFDEINSMETSEITGDEKEYLIHFVRLVMQLCMGDDPLGVYKRNQKFIRFAAGRAKEYFVHFSIVEEYKTLRWLVNCPSLFFVRCRLVKLAKKILRR
ncbi:MAG: glycosyltransferase [Clostridiales bacterium]|nr:glycosyltransferase [Clostridiales bacterium]